MNTRAKLLEIAEFCDNFETRTTYRFDYSTYVYGITACAFAAAAIHNVAGLEARHYGSEQVRLSNPRRPGVLQLQDPRLRRVVLHRDAARRLLDRAHRDRDSRKPREVQELDQSLDAGADAVGRQRVRALA